MRIYACIYIIWRCIRIGIRIGICIYVQTWVQCAHLFVHHVNKDTYVHKRTCTRVCVYTSMYINTYIYIYAYMYTHTHVNTDIVTRICTCASVLYTLLTKSPATQSAALVLSRLPFWAAWQWPEPVSELITTLVPRL